jgi:hypothetical protein
MDYLRYIEKGSNEPLPGFDYIAYSGDDEKSSGVFKNDGILTGKAKKDLRNALRETESVIWHGIVSFEEAFGKRYVGSIQEAYRMMKLEFPRFLKSAGFDPDKIEWYAGLHENTLHRHIHYSFFEKEPSRYSERGKGLQYSHGKIAQRHFERFKIAIEQRLTDITGEIVANRKDITELTRNLLFSSTNKTRYHDELQTRLSGLVADLPAAGRLAYDSENMRPLKPQVKEIANCLIKYNPRLYNRFEDYCVRVKAKDAQTLESLESSKVKESEWPKYLIADKYLDDIYRRIGNQIISAARVLKNREKKTGNRLANTCIRRRTVLGVLEYAIKLQSEIERDAMEAFDEYLQRLENEKINIREEYESEMG